MVGQDLSPLILGGTRPDSITGPIYFMIEDDPYRGLHMERRFARDGRPPMEDPKCIETVIARLGGDTLWKFSRYWESEQVLERPK